MMLLHKRGAPALLLPTFLKEVYVGQRTGLLHVTLDEHESVTFRAVNGELVSGSSTAERGRLGECMIRRGQLSRADLDHALAIVAREGRRLAPVLRELDLVDTPGLEEALAFHIREMLVTALRWESCVLLFEDQELPDAPAEDLTLRCSTAGLILELVRQIPDLQVVHGALGDLGRPLLAAEGPSPIEPDLVGPLERHLLSGANGRSSARTLIAASPRSPDEAARALLGLVLTGALQFAAAPPPLPVAAG